MAGSLSIAIPARNYTGLAAGKANTIFILELPPTGAASTSGSTLHRFDLEKRKLDKLLDGICFLKVSQNGEKMLYRQGRSWIIASTATPPRPVEGVLKTSVLRLCA